MKILKGLIRIFVIPQLLAFFVAMVFYLFASNAKIPFRNFLIPSLFFSNFNYFAHAYIFNGYVRKIMQSKLSNSMKLITAISAFLVIAILATEAAMGAMALFLKYKYFSSLTSHLFVIAAASLIGVVTFLGFYYYELTKKKLELRTLEVEELRQLQLQSKLISMQAKINPHFLFNTLNTVVELVHSEPDKVERIVLNLSDMYRSVLNLPEEGMIPIHQELDLITKYLNTEKERLGDRLIYSIQCDEACTSLMIPPLLIEPLVENAVIHGIAKKRDGGSVTVIVALKEKGILVTVSDTGKGFDVAQIREGFGVKSVRERVAIQYKDKGAFTITSEPEKGTTVHLEIPHV